jgi:CHAT domain-containing protein
MRNAEENDMIKNMQFPKGISGVFRMQKHQTQMPDPHAECLTNADISTYISRQSRGEEFRNAEAHLGKCASCRQKLADALYILDPDTEGEMEGIPDVSGVELGQTIAKIRALSEKTHSSRKSPIFRFKWPIAAAAIVFLSFGLWGLMHLYDEINKSQEYLSRATASLAQNFGGTSRSNLRLSLPFDQKPAERINRNAASLKEAENLFFQAIAVRGDIIEAHLGLAYIDLSESRFPAARAEFQKALNIDANNIHALIGRGVSQYEESVEDKDPVLRGPLLTAALGDFDAVLKLNPDSLEARFNKIWTLFESGLHQEALREIDSYFSRDSESLWAEKLRGLKIKIQASRYSAVEEEVYRAAQNRDRGALWELARQVPYQIPAAIWSVMRQNLELNPSSVNGNVPNSNDLFWAAETMEAAYGSFSGDHSFKAFLAFYSGLSPPQRMLKRELDKEFQSLVRNYQESGFVTVLRRSKFLESQYALLKDYWQLINLHHLLGNSHYFGSADFGSAEAEFHRMLDLSDRLNAPDPTAKALGSLAMIYGMEGKIDESLSCAYRLKNLAASHKLESWQITAGVTIGNQLGRVGQFEQSAREYTAALKIACRLLDGTRIIEILENLGLVMDRLERIQEAKRFYSQALDRQESFLRNHVIQPAPLTAIRRLNLLSHQGELYLRTGEYDSAETFFGESLRSTPLGMSELEARNRIGLATIFLRTGRWPQAKSMMRSLAAINASGQYFDIEWQEKLLEGKLLEKTGDSRQALVRLQQAVEILERMRRHVKSDDLRQSFLMDRYEPFRILISLLFKSSAASQRMLEFVDRAKSMTLREQLSLQHLSWESLEKSYANIGKNIAYPIVEYFFIDDGILIFITREAHTEIVYRNVPRADCSRIIRNYLESIRKNDSDTFHRIARQLYNELIAPIEQHIFAGPHEMMVILPEGPLHLLPFAGLQDPQGRFLIEKIPIAFAPSRSVFWHCMLSHRRRIDENHSTVLIDGSSTLPSAQKELGYISKIYGKNASVLGSGDLPKFGETIARSDIIHFSGHATTIYGKPHLLLRSSPPEIYLNCQQINSWQMPHAYLVNLAACSTGIGPLSEGESPWGLIPAFLNAGAPAVIASLMPVDDESTRILNCHFYDFLKKGFSKAEALQAAQIGLIVTARKASSNKPQSWIPYILIGNPQ